MKKYSPLICLLIFLQFSVHVYLRSCSVSYLQISAKDHRFPLATALSVKGINEGLSSLGQRREGTLFEILVTHKFTSRFLYSFIYSQCIFLHTSCLYFMDRGLIYSCLSLSSSKKLQLISELQELVDNYIQGFSLCSQS